MMNLRSCLMSVLLLLAAGPTLATDRVDDRQQNQRARIVEGVTSGELTAPEAHRLAHGQQHVRQVERRVEADGVVTAKEAARLEHAQDVQSARIKRQKHDRQDR